MTQTSSRISGPQLVADADREISLLEVAAVVLRRWKLIALCVLVMGALATAWALASPRKWTSKVVLVPSSGGGDSRMQMLAAQLAIPGLAGRLGGGTGMGQNVVAAIVKSKAVRDSVSQEMRRTRQVTMTKKRLDKLLKRSSGVDTDPVNRSITISVTTTDPRLSQRLAAAFPNAVNAIATQIAFDAAAHKRETLERQIELARQNLQRSQAALLSYQERTGTPQIQEQARQAVAAAAELQRGITAQEIKVAQLRRVTTEDNPEYRAAAAQLETLRGQLRRLTSQGSEVFLSKGALPGMQLELARRLRDYTKDEQIYTSLTADLVNTQLDLNDNLEVVSVLDAAQVPDEPSGFGRKMKVLLGMFFGGMIGLGLAYAIEYLEKARRTAPDEPFFQEWDRFRGKRANGKTAGVA